MIYRDLKIFWHNEPIDRVLETLHTKSGGLSKEEALQRIQNIGKNIITESKSKSYTALFLSQLKNPLIYTQK